MQRVRNLFRAAFEPSATSVNGAASRVDLRDVTSTYTQIDLAPLDVLKTAPVWMAPSEKLLLYALIYAIRPERYLEIGSWEGGSALTVVAAMDAAKTRGVVICVDPKPNFAEGLVKQIRHRAKIITAYSPDALPEAQRAADGVFDFVLIDGDHSYLGALSDARGVMRHITDDAWILVHDSHNPIVTRAIDDFVGEYGGRVIDLGHLTREFIQQPLDGQPSARWFGFRLLKAQLGARQKVI